MSKKSCEAAESIEDALLRMARVKCNKKISGFQHTAFYPFRQALTFVPLESLCAGFNWFRTSVLLLYSTLVSSPGFEVEEIPEK